jgi:hypothetical protein
MTQTALNVAILLLIAGTVAVAFVRGGGPERAIALVLLASFLFQTAGRAIIPASFDTVDAVRLSTDLLTTIGLILVAVRAKRFWPLPVVSMQIIMTGAHFARAIEVDISRWSYVLMSTGLSYAMLALVWLGVKHHQQRLRQVGHDPCWQTSWIYSDRELARRLQSA